ncbi:hypothetical protein DFH08DRAFT_938612 [Mycena albidolilacea]|uniref:Uncharacterized protein n=1 Tax=Mycena albidolilacea TaxID=1033008 RepID=A0AAD6ZWD6_9AGAR|nr:hypothetical protein DFH08DRAFT_938612 [Mycena albidolilacea]
MSDPTLCRGTDPEGNQCICLRAKETYLDDDTNRTLCKNCGHIESAHPEPPTSAGTMVRGFRDAARFASSSSHSVKATHQEAEAEMSAGLRPKKRKSDTDTEPPSKKSHKEGKGKEKAVKFPEGEKVKYGKLVFLTCGISEGALRNPKVPSGSDMNEMRRAGLVVLSTPSKPLLIDTAWNNDRVNSEIKKLLPKPIEFLKRHAYPGRDSDLPELQNQLWLGIIRQGKTLTLASDALPTGVELADHTKFLGRSAADRVLFLASKLKIPQRRWDWADSESEDLGSDIDTVKSEDIVMTPRKKLAAANKPKIKMEDVPEEVDTDMRKAAKMRTRLASGSITHKPLFIPESSDIDPLIISSDDDASTPPPAPTLVSSIAIPAGLGSSPEPQSPNRDPPTFFDDFTMNFGAPSFVGLGPPAFAGSSTSAVAGPSTSTSPWAIDSGGGEASSTPRLSPPPPSRVISSGHGMPESAPRFKKNGQGSGRPGSLEHRRARRCRRTVELSPQNSGGGLYCPLCPSPPIPLTVIGSVLLNHPLLLCLHLTVFTRVYILLSLLIFLSPFLTFL